MEYTLEHKTNKKLTHGLSRPRGAIVKKTGVNFSVFSKYAKEVYLLLFDTPLGEPTDIIKLSHTGHVWHVFVCGIGDRQLYGYKVKGDYNPKEGMRFNAMSVLGLVSLFVRVWRGFATPRETLQEGL